MNKVDYYTKRALTIYNNNESMLGGLYALFDPSKIKKILFLKFVGFLVLDVQIFSLILNNKKNCK